MGSVLAVFLHGRLCDLSQAMSSGHLATQQAGCSSSSFLTCLRNNSHLEAEEHVWGEDGKHSAHDKVLIDHGVANGHPVL